jgi:hypothetical protein
MHRPKGRRRLKRRQKDILRALRELGGEASTEEISDKTGLNVNGVSQSLGALSSSYVICLGGKGGKIRWKLR